MPHSPLDPRSVALAVSAGLALSLSCKDKKDEPIASSSANAVASADPSQKACCKGQNACKGKGGCAVPGKHDCAGQNACKGQGGCNMHCPK